MRWHVVGAFGIMLEIVGVLRHQPVEKFFEIAPCRWISILHHDQTATGVLRENCNNAIFNIALPYKRFDLVGNLVGSFSCCRDGEILVLNSHALIIIFIPSAVERSRCDTRRRSPNYWSDEAAVRKLR